ncbi:MAG: deoxyribose-phosphate aldolase [Bacteroidota bacterium]|jgi:deoxyribose-phosphate aldolase
MKHLSSIIEHTILKPDTTLRDVQILCDEALQHGFYGVCVPPFHVREAVKRINEAAKVVTVVGFPMGYSTIPAKVEEIKKAIDEGASELDAVINIAAVKSENWATVKTELESMSRAVAMRGKVLKLILETSLLTETELLKILPIIEGEGVAFVKTSTGFAGAGATVKSVQFLREHLSTAIKIKASGGIKTAEFAQQLLNAGANRIGSSASVSLILG